MTCFPLEILNECDLECLLKINLINIHNAKVCTNPDNRKPLNKEGQRGGPGG